MTKKAIYMLIVAFMLLFVAQPAMAEGDKVRGNEDVADGETATHRIEDPDGWSW